MDKDAFDRWEEERRERQTQRDARKSERRQQRREEHAQEGPGSERKERVLHTRISEHLDDSIRQAAGHLRVPVSNLVRNILEDVFDVVETVTDNVGDLVDDVLDEVDRARGDYGRRVRRQRHRSGRRPQKRDDPARAEAEREVEELENAPAEDPIERAEFPELVGWQPLFLNGSQRCVDCGRDLVKGDRAVVGMTASGLSDKYLCRDCMNAR